MKKGTKNPHTVEWNKKIGEALKKHKRTAEHSLNISKAKKGVYCIKRQKRVILKCDNCKMEFVRKQSRADRYKMHFCSLQCLNLNQKGKKRSEQWVIRSRELNSGKGNPMFGKHHTLSAKKKIGTATRIAAYTKPRIYANTSIEIKMQQALTNAGVYFELNKALYGLPDIFIKPKICIFCDGDYWHANPDYHKAGEIISKGRTAREIWQKDADITKTLHDMGYIVLRFWERDINNNIEYCLSQVMSVVKMPLEYSTAKEIER